MKLIRSKLGAALVLVAISFGVFSFTTTPVYAEATVSTVSHSPLLLLDFVPDLPASALQEANAEAAAAAARAALEFAKNVAAGILGSLLTNLVGYEIVESQAYPIDALDP